MSSDNRLPMRLEPQPGTLAVRTGTFRRRPAPPPADRVRKIISVLRRRKLPFLAVFLFVLSAVAFYTWRQTPQYVATASLLVNSRVLNVQPKANDVVPASEAEDGAVKTEIQILRSNDVAYRVIQVMSADPRKNFMTKVTGLPAESAGNAILDAIKSRMDVTRPGSTNVLGISFKSDDPVLAAQVANEFARQYVIAKGDTRLSAARIADKSLLAELATMRGRVEEAEAAVAQYRRDHNLLSASGVTLTEQEQSLYKQQESAAETALAEERARLNTARSQMSRGSSGDDVGEALSSPVVSQLRGQRAQVSAKLAELQARYKSSHPEVVKAQGELADIDRGIQQEISRVMSNLEARVQVAQQRAGSASGIAGQARGTLAVNAAASVRLNELERRAEALRTNYAAMLERQTAVASQSVVADVDARLLSEALPPKHPTSPNRKLNLALGMLIAGLIGAMVVWLLQIFDRTLVSSQDVEENLNLPHIMNIPTIKSILLPKERSIPAIDFVLDRPLSMIAEAIRGVLLTLDKSGSSRKTRLVGLTSARPGEGKSTVAAWLAQAAAAGGRHTLLIDGDVRRPSIATMFGLTPTAGLIEVLSGKVALKDALIQDKRSGAWILPSISQAFAPGQVTSEKALQSLVAQLIGVFELVIIDTAPALAAVESRLLMDYVDDALMVVRWNHTPLPAIRAAMKRLASVGIKPMGMVMTQVNMKAIASYGFDDIDYEYRSYMNYGS